MKIRTEKGITLIALIITIIVMLILVGVSVTVALNGGLFTTAQKATAKTQLELDKEQLLEMAIGAIGDDGKVNLSKLDEYIAATNGKFTGSNGVYTSEDGNKFRVSGNGSVMNYAGWQMNTTSNSLEYIDADGNVAVSEIKIGDKVDYKTGTGLSYTTDTTKGAGGSYTNGALTEATYTTATSTQEETEWRVLGTNDNGEIELVSTKPTSTTITLYGKQGYLNAESILNGFCNNLYGQGNGASSARSLTAEDINKLSGYEDTQYGTNYSFKGSGGYLYGILTSDNMDTSGVTGWSNYGPMEIWTPETVITASTSEITTVPYTYPAVKLDGITNSYLKTAFSTYTNAFIASKGFRTLLGSEAGHAVAFLGSMYASLPPDWVVNYNAEEDAAHEAWPVVTLNYSVELSDDNADGTWEIN